MIPAVKITDEKQRAEIAKKYFRLMCDLKPHSEIWFSPGLGFAVLEFEVDSVGRKFCHIAGVYGKNLATKSVMETLLELCRREKCSGIRTYGDTVLKKRLHTRLGFVPSIGNWSEIIINGK